MQAGRGTDDRASHSCEAYRAEREVAHFRRASYRNATHPAAGSQGKERQEERGLEVSEHIGAPGSRVDTQVGVPA